MQKTTYFHKKQTFIKKLFSGGKTLITKEICFTDAFGKQHICHEVGCKKFIRVDSRDPIRAQVAFAVRTASNHICHSIKILQGARYDSYIVYNDSYLYFARTDTCDSIEVIMDGSDGFQIPEGHKYKFHSEWDITIFWLVNTRTQPRVSPYKCILW